MIYLLPLLMLVIGCLSFDRIRKNDKSNILWILIYFTLVAIIGLRYKVGGDTYNYMNYFAWISDLPHWRPDLSGFEPGFSLLTSAIKTVSDNIYVYQIIVSAMMTFMLMYFIKQNTTHKFLAMLFVFVAMYLYFSTEVIRESLAVGGLLMAYPLLRDHRYATYYAVCLILLSLHSSAVLCFLLPFFRDLKFNRNFFLYIIITVVIGFAMPSIMERIGSNYFIFQKLLRYNQYRHVGYAWCGLRFIYFSVLPFLTLHLCKHRFHLKCKFENIICLQILLGVGIWFVPIVFQRLINYTIIFYLVSLADIIGTVTRNLSYRAMLTAYARRARTQLANMLLLLTILAHSSYYIHLNFYEIYIPYHSIFDPIEEPMREKYVAGQD